MTAKFRNKYRGQSTRLQRWNYGWNAAYFITICTKGREWYFGEVVNGAMQLSPVGIIADELWHEIRNHAKNVELGEFVVMPNHIHGIIILNGNKVPWTLDPKDDPSEMDDETVGPRPVAARRALPQQPNQSTESEKTIGQQRFQNQGKNTVSSIVGSYKSAVTKHAHRSNLEFAWQSLFHDHIIRNEKAFQRITDYIRNNPINWREDKFHL